LRERLDVKALSGRLAGFWRRVDKRPCKIRRVGVYLWRNLSSSP